MSSNPKCLKAQKDLTKGKVLGKGAFGTVREWAKNKVVKVETCNEIEYKRKGFMEDVEERKRLTKNLSARGLAAKTLEHMECGNACITFMEKIDGMTLRDYVSKNNSREAQEKIIRQAASAIESMHNMISIAHGDLHTGNIMVTNKGKIKFIDFAFERRLEKYYDWQFFLESLKKHTSFSGDELKEMVKSYVSPQILNKVNI